MLCGMKVRDVWPGRLMLTSKPCYKSFSRLSSCQLSHCFTVSKQKYDRNSMHTKPARKSGVFLSIDLNNNCFSRQ